MDEDDDFLDNEVVLAVVVCTVDEEVIVAGACITVDAVAVVVEGVTIVVDAGVTVVVVIVDDAIIGDMTEFTVPVELITPFPYFVLDAVW